MNELNDQRRYSLAFRKGQADYLSGTATENNPFSDDFTKSAWLDGWRVELALETGHEG